MCYVWRHMDSIEKLKKMFEPVLSECSVQLYELKWLGGKDKTLQVSIMKDDGTMDLDTCAEVSEKLGEVLDREDPISAEYTLEVCSPGAEREIHNLDELDHMIGEYVFVKLKNPVGKVQELTGEIVGSQDGLVTVSYRDKALTRKCEFSKDDIEFIRLAVRI